MQNSMQECLKLLKNPWMYIVSVLTFVVLVLSLGTELFEIRFYESISPEDLFAKSFTSKETLLSLPILSALPFAGDLTEDFKSGFFRPYIFRVGIKSYVISKTLALVLSVFMSQLTGTLLFSFFLNAISGSFFLEFHIFFSRIMLGIIFALMGSSFALIQKDKNFGLVMPIAFALFFGMIGDRIFYNINFLKFTNLIRGDFTLLLLVTATFLLMLYQFFLIFEVKKHA